MTKPHYCVLNLDNYLDYKAFEKTLIRSNQEAISGPMDSGKLTGTKNVCVKVLPETAEELERTCSALGITKSLFLRLAIDDALGRAFERIDNITKDDDDWHDEIQQEGAA